MKCDKLVDVGRRQFMRGGIIASAGAAATAVMGSGAAQAQTAPMTLRWSAIRPTDLAICPS